MRRLFLLPLLFGFACHIGAADPDIGNLTQAELAAKVGFPHRVETLSATADGGPGELFWFYCQRSPSGKIEEKMIAFKGHPLRVSMTSQGIIPSRFLSVERPSDVWQIRQYQTAHPH